MNTSQWEPVRVDRIKMKLTSVRATFGCLLAATALSLSISADAQTLTVLHSFTNSPDGDQSFCGLVLSGNTLYGVATKGGVGTGIVFRINTDGTCFTNLHSFAVTGTGFTNTGGAYPEGGLVLSGNMLYGSTIFGGTGGNGTLYTLDTGGMNFTNLHNFSALSNLTNSDGANPQGSLALSPGGTLFGTAYGGGPALGGVLFSICTNGTGFTNAYTFFGNQPAPQGGVALSGSTIYGESGGGFYSAGYLFRVGTNGTAFTNLYNFSVETTSGNSDGANPAGVLTVSGNTLYGITLDGGAANDGTIFRISTGGTGFATLHNFTGTDAANPAGGLFLTNNILYGAASSGGSTGYGAIYQFNLSNSNLVTLFSFPPTSGSSRTNTDGAVPGGEDSLAIGGDTLYATASAGGRVGDGTVVAVTLPPPPQLSINPSGSSVVLSWPTNSAAFILQSAANLVSPLTWNNVLPVPVVVNGRNTVTNSISATRVFYRLSQ
jgi:uncharacterized repeat protein (TIGR03803 family)